MLVNLNIVSARLSQNASIGRRFSSADHCQRNRENQAEDHHLQHGVIGHRLGDVLGEDVQDGVFCAEFGDAGRVGRCGSRELHANAGFAQVDGAEPQEDRDRW